MKKLKQISLLTVLTLSLTTIASAGTITGGRTTAVGTITGGRTGTITGGRTGTITGGRTGTITGGRTGTITGGSTEMITGSRFGIIPTQSGSRITIQEELLAGFWSLLTNVVW